MIQVSDVVEIRYPSGKTGFVPADSAIAKEMEVRKEFVRAEPTHAFVDCRDCGFGTLEELDNPEFNGAVKCPECERRTADIIKKVIVV